MDREARNYLSGLDLAQTLELFEKLFNNVAIGNTRAASTNIVHIMESVVIDHQRTTVALERIADSLDRLVHVIDNK